MRTILLTVLVSVATLSVVGQEDKRLLSFDEALDKTMSNNPQISAIGYEEKAAEQEKKAAFGLRLPKIGVMGTYAHLGDDIGLDFNSLKAPVGGILGGMAGSLPEAVLGQVSQLMGANWGVTIQDKDMAFVSGTITMPIYTGGKINAANNAAQIKMEAARSRGDQTRNGLVSELVERYYGLALANQVVELRRQVLEGMKVHLEDAKAMEANGMIAKGDRLYVEVKVSEAERELRNSQLQVQTIADALCNTLNQNEDYVPVSNMFIISDLESVTYFQDLASRKNPLLNQVALKKDLANEGVRLQRSEFLPQVALMGGTHLYNYQVSKYLPTWAVGAGVKINIFDGLHREYKYSAAKNTVRQIDAIQVKANKDVSTLIEKIYNQMRNYNNQMPSIDTSMEFAREYLRIKESAFKEGMGSSSDVIDAQLNLAKIKIERVQSAFYYDVMLAKLLEAAGVSDEFLSYSQRASSQQIKF